MLAAIAVRRWCRRVKLIAEYDKANPGKSTRQVAEALGDVSHMAVNRARQNSGATDVTPEKVTGADGKSYPASRPITIDNPPN